MDRTALVVGATGIAGYNTAQALWPPVGALSGCPESRVTRSPASSTCYGDVLDPESVEAAVAGTGITHLFFTTWSRQDTEAQNCAVNGAMLANTLEALRRTTRLQHAVLITGLKHYLGPFEAYAAAPGRDAVPREPGSPAVPELLLRPGGHPVRGGGRAGLHLVGAPAAHDDRLRPRQRHEHGRHSRGVRQHLPRDRRAVRVSGQPAAVRRRHRHHRCPAARPPRRLVGDRAGRPQPGVQHGQR